MTNNNIFFENGEPMSMFVEAARIVGRPRLLKDLQRAGATISVSPLTARIILVDSQTPEGLTFAANWPNKPVLDVLWARQALSQGVYAPEIEEWGGHRVFASEEDIPRESSVPPPTTRHTTLAESTPTTQQQPPRTLFDTDSLAAAFLHNFPQQSPLSSASHSGIHPAVSVAFGGASNIAPWAENELVRRMVATLTQGNTAQLHTQSSPTSREQWLNQGIYSPTHPSHPPINQPSMIYDTPSRSPPPYAATGSSSSPWQREPSPAGNKRKHKYSHPSQSPAAERSGESGRRPGRTLKRRFEDMEDSAMESTPPYTPRQPTSHTNRKQLFKGKAGKMLSFYVQPSIRHRNLVVDSIKKHSGIITAEVSEADFVVLAQTADHFEDALRSAIALDIPAVKASFIDQCIANGSLADPARFSFDGETVRRKRGLPFVVDLEQMRAVSSHEKKKTSTPVKPRRSRGKGKQRESPRESSMDDEISSELFEDKRVVEDNAETPRKQSQPQRREQMTGSSSLAHSVASQRSPSPTPPKIENTPLNTNKSGKNTYVQEEKEYWPRYLEHVLKYDPDIPFSRVAQMLAHKLPRHTPSSWSQVISAQNRVQVDEMRKKAHIAARKAATTAVPPADSAALPIPRVSPLRPPTTQDFGLDFENVTDFILNGGAENKTDEEAWEALTLLERCRTQASWATYWAENGEAVTAEVQRRAEATADDGTVFQIKEESQS